MAVPSILMVAPSGTAKPATLLGTPKRVSTVRKVIGRVAPEDAVEKANAHTRRILARSNPGFSPVVVFKSSEYTTIPWKISRPDKVRKYAAKLTMVLNP